MHMYKRNHLFMDDWNILDLEKYPYIDASKLNST